MRTKSARPRSDPRLVYLLSVAQRRMQRSVATWSPKGVTATQSGLLLVLGQRDGALLGEAGAALDLGMAGISGLVDRTVEAGLIVKRAHPDDGRAWQLWLTAAGKRALARVKAGAAELNSQLKEGFTDAEIDVVARWLASVQRKFPKGADE